MCDMSAIGSQVMFLAFLIRMPILDEILDCISDGFRQTVGIPLQLSLTDQPPSSLGIEFEDPREGEVLILKNPPEVPGFAPVRS